MKYIKGDYEKILWRWLEIWIDKSRRNNIKPISLWIHTQPLLFRSSSTKSFVFQLRILTGDQKKEITKRWNLNIPL
jgi:hypothetical protein